MRGVGEIEFLMEGGCYRFVLKISTMYWTIDHTKSAVNMYCNRNEKSVDKKNQLDVTFVFFISLLLVAQHVSCNHVPIIRS